VFTDINSYLLIHVYTVSLSYALNSNLTVAGDWNTKCSCSAFMLYMIRRRLLELTCESEAATHYLMLYCTDSGVLDVS